MESLAGFLLLAEDMMSLDMLDTEFVIFICSISARSNYRVFLSHLFLNHTLTISDRRCTVVIIQKVLQPVKDVARVSSLALRKL